MFAPPIRVNTLTVSSPPSISASRRSISSPPMTATALMLPTARNRPCRCEPLMMATIQRTGLLVLTGAGCVWPCSRLLRQVAGQRGELARGLRGQGPAGALLELIQGEPADGGMVAEHPQRDVALGVGDPKGIVRVGHYWPLPWRAAQQEYARAGTRSKPTGGDAMVAAL